MIEEEALLAGAYKTLVGIYTPSAAGVDSEAAVILLNAGLIHRVGPHRLHVTLARALAARGIASLRVDLSGIGDSAARPDNLPAKELAVREPQEIMDDLARRGHRHFILFGICSGARQALQAAACDPRVTGLVLINPGSSADYTESAARAAAQFYLRRSLWNLRAWMNFFSGRVNYRRLFQSLAGALRPPSGSEDRSRDDDKMAVIDEARRQLEPLLARGTRVLVVFSDRDAQYLRLMKGGVERLQMNGQPQVEIYPEADHLFASLADTRTLVEVVCRWMGSLAEAPSESDEVVARRVLSRD